MLSLSTTNPLRTCEISKKTHFTGTFLNFMIGFVMFHYLSQSMYGGQIECEEPSTMNAKSKQEGCRVKLSLIEITRCFQYQMRNASTALNSYFHGLYYTNI